MDSDFELSDTENEIPEEILEAAKKATYDILPVKSKARYEKSYDAFKNCCREKKVKNVSEEVLLAYFAEKSQKLASSTLWSLYSMLKSMLAIKDNVNINNFFKLITFIKKKSIGHKPKKSKILSREQIETFLNNAPDSEYLMLKVS